MEKKSLLSRLQSIPKKTLYMIGGVILGVIVLISLVILVCTRTAETNAKAFEKDLATYTDKLVKAKSTYKDLSSVASNPPHLKTVVFGSLNDTYKKATAKQAVLTVYQDELFTPLTKYDKNNKFNDKLLLAEREFNSKYSEDIYDSSRQVIRTRYEDDFGAYKSAANAYLSKKIALYQQYRQSVERTDSGEYGKRLKQFYVNQIDNGINDSRQRLDKVKSASSFGQIRYLMVADKIDEELPSAHIGYPLYAANVAYTYFYFMTSPAVQSFQETMKNLSADKESEARITAYTALYGSMAAGNIPGIKNSDVNIQRKLGTAYFALYRLRTLINGDEDISKAQRTTILKKVAAAETAITNTSFGEDQTELPSAIGRMVEYNTILSDISEYNGFADSRSNFRSVIDGGPKIAGSTFSVDQGWATIKAAEYILPSGYFAKDVTAYKKAMDTCTGARLTFQKKSVEVMNKQLEINKNILNITKKLDAVAKETSPTDKQMKQLNQWKADITAANSKIDALDKELPAAIKAQNTVLDTCLPVAEAALLAIKAKSDDRKTHLDYLHNIARAIYQ